MTEFSNDNALKSLYDNYRSLIENDLNPYNAGGYRFVWGFGNVNADVVLIGEAPGRDEVEQGRPFVGKAGHILDDFLEKTAINREELFITNTIKYRLARVRKGYEGVDNASIPNSLLSNRPAGSDEIKTGAKLLRDEISVIKPRVVVTMGNVPLKAMLIGTDVAGTIGDLHGRPINANGCILFPIYHPASLIYNRALAGEYEKDLERLKGIMKDL